MTYVKQKISFVALGGQKSVLPAPPSPSVALTVLRGQKWCSSWPFVDSKRCSPRPSAALRVLRGQKRCSPRPLVALRGQKKAVLRAPPRPSVSSADKKGVLPDPSWPFADKIKLFSAPLPAALRVLRGQKRCSPRPLVALRGQKKAVLRAPPRPSVSSADKKGVLPDPSWPFADKKKQFSASLRGPPCPPWTKKGVLPAPSPPSRTKHTLPLQSQFTQTPTTPNLYPARKVRPPSGP